MIYFPIPMHLEPALDYLGGKLGDFPEAECSAREVISLPIYPELSEAYRESVICAIKNFFRKS
jgi:dTDP-4-amino-4,6-dideoxygalactose transaminase